jgi:hypothetical protein
MGKHMRNQSLIAAAAILFLAASWVHGQDMPIPGDIQAPLFKKIFSYDKSLQGSSEVIVFLLGSEADEPSMIEMIKAFQAVGLLPVMVNASVLEEDASPNTVVYLMPGADKELIAKFCADNEILSISGVPPLAEQGHVSISIDENGGNPQIVVNLQRLRTEGHTLAADVLKLARVIQ